MLIVPLCVMLEEDPQQVAPKGSKGKKKEDNKSEEEEEDAWNWDWKSSLATNILPTSLLFASFIGLLLYLSYLLMGSWSFLWATYGFILSVPELTPNMGLWWYFFTEMFDHFRVFFVATFQLNVFIYVIPLTLRLRRHPYLLAYTLLALIAIFKSYPCYGDVGLYLGLLPTMRHLFPYTKQLFIVGCMLVATTALGPIVLHLWIYAGSANANYFFAINLVFGTAQVLSPLFFTIKMHNC